MGPSFSPDHSQESPVSPTSTRSDGPLLPPAFQTPSSPTAGTERETGFQPGNIGDVEKCAGMPSGPTVLMKPLPWFPRWRRNEVPEPLFETNCRTLESCPNGYPRLAAFVSSDHNFTLYRGFSYVHARVLLALQQEVGELEQELDEYDEDNKNDERRLKSWDVDRIKSAEEGKDERTRPVILSDLRVKLLEYDEVLLKAREMQGFQQPSDRDYRSVRRWLFNMKPLISEEMAYIKCKEDIVTLRHGRECAGFDGLVESMLQRLDCRITRYMFCTAELRKKTSDENLYYYSPSRVDTLVGIIITIVIFTLLIIPVVVMYQLTSFGTHSSIFHAIGVLIVFTLLFGAAMSVLTRARRHELFAASAAYCAVLVVFISNFGNGIS